MTNMGRGNTGDWNIGNNNTGDWNTGHNNTGNNNTGHWNTGGVNTGDRNTGYFNTGNDNTGHWNIGNRNTGFFNTFHPKEVYCFNKPVDYDEYINAQFPKWLLSIQMVEAIPTDPAWERKKGKPSIFSVQQLLKKKDFKQACREAFSKATPEDIE